MALADIDVRGQARRTPLASQIQQFIDGCEILLGNAQARLRAAKFHIALRHIGEHRDQHGAVILDRDLHAGFGSLHGTANASEQIDLPGGAGAQLKLIVGIRNAWRRREMRAADRIEQRAGRRRFAEALPAVGGIERQRGPVGRRGNGTLRARLIDPQHRGAQIQIRVQGALDQRVEQRIVEAAPPGAKLRWLAP